MTTHQLRTFVEHHLLPQLFFEHRAAILAKLFSEEGKFLTELYKDVAESNDETSPYTVTDFKIIPFDLKDGYRALFIEQPVPEEPLECYLIAMCFKMGDEDVDNLRYFTIEKASSSPLIEMLREKLDQKVSAPAMMLCEWTEDQTHRNHGPLSPDEEIGKRIGDILKNEQ